MSLASVETIKLGGLVWYYRPSTNDLGIIEQGFVANACALPEDMSGMLYIDIGAHIGSVALLAASRGANVEAYEPVRANYEMLLRNIRSNNLSITAIPTAVGHGSHKKLYLNEYNTGMNSEFADISGNFREDLYEVVNVIPLTDIIRERQIDFLKIDCEGCEEQILEDVFNGLYHQIRFISCEFHFPSSKYLLQKMAYLYDIKSIGSTGYLFERKPNHA